MVIVNFWLYFYVAVMAAGALLFQGWGRRPSGVPAFEYAVATVIPIWSGLCYLAMALGQGLIEVDGRTVYLPRYIDWIVTTPLLLLALASTAMFWRALDKTLIAGLMATDAIMILAGLVADLTPDGEGKWLWYAIGCACLAVILVVVWGPLRRTAEAQSPELGRVYRKVAGYLTLLWLGYPTVWALGPSGAGLLDSSTDTILFVFLPILSKVGFSILDLAELRKLGAREPSHSVSAAEFRPIRHA